MHTIYLIPCNEFNEAAEGETATKPTISNDGLACSLIEYLQKNDNIEHLKIHHAPEKEAIDMAEAFENAAHAPVTVTESQDLMFTTKELDLIIHTINFMQTLEGKLKTAKHEQTPDLRDVMAGAQTWQTNTIIIATPRVIEALAKNLQSFGNPRTNINLGKVYEFTSQDTKRWNNNRFFSGETGEWVHQENRQSQFPVPQN